MRLRKFLNRAAVALEKKPSAVSKVKGFSITVEKKEGVLLTSKKGDQKVPASEADYYEVTVNVDGSNPEYPASEKPYVRAFTTALQKNWVGMTGGVSYIPDGARWTGFELIEVYDKCEEPPMGKWMPAHHRVDLIAHYQDALSCPQRISYGAWVRKSDLESPAWKAAANSPITYC